jgi:hypothetical protein
MDTPKSAARSLPKIRRRLRIRISATEVKSRPRLIASLATATKIATLTMPVVMRAAQAVGNHCLGSAVQRDSIFMMILLVTRIIVDPGMGRIYYAFKWGGDNTLLGKYENTEGRCFIHT